MAVIKLLNKVGAVGSITSLTPTFTYPPAEEKITYNDVSRSDAGRLEDGKMEKYSIGTCVKLELKWNNVSTAVAKYVTDAFKSEYFDVDFFDVVTNAYRTATFYAGDRSGTVYNATLNIWESITVNLIERSPHIY